jgi:hypothetical protein
MRSLASVLVLTGLCLASIGCGSEPSPAPESGPVVNDAIPKGVSKKPGSKVDKVKPMPVPKGRKDL